MVYMLLFKRSLSERFINRNPVLHKIAVVISARNESAVIGQLIESIHAQTYPAELIRIYVCADNCTDNTAEVAREAVRPCLRGRTAISSARATHWTICSRRFFRRMTTAMRLSFLTPIILSTAMYIAEMNKTFGLGFEAITSYRNSKNYGTNWISAGYSLWFLA